MSFKYKGKAICGAGIPPGGKAGQVLAKRSGDDYDVQWDDVDTIYTPPEEARTEIYGAQWDGNPSPIWARTDDASLFMDPNPYVNDGQHPGYSPFDNILPWAGMKVVDRPNCGKMVSIPKFYYNMVPLHNNGLKIQISMTKHPGFYTSPAHMDRGDGFGERNIVYVGRYHSTNDYTSKAGASPAIPNTWATTRAGIHALGDTVWQYDYLMQCTIQLLYLVEFANFNSQAVIGYGCGNGSSVETVGKTDTMPYHTGTMQSKRDTYGVGVQYRYIEGLWDTARDKFDGCRFTSSGDFLITINPSDYVDNSNEISVGKYTTTQGYGKVFQVSTTLGFPIFYCTEVNGTDSTYLCDRVGCMGDNGVGLGGNAQYQVQTSGLFSMDTIPDRNANTTCRIQELPNDAGV